MSTRISRFLLSAVTLPLLIAFSHASAQEAGLPAAARNVEQMTLGPLPNLPTCMTGSVQSGDPAKAPSIIFAKLSGGCSIPWHWHTPNERVMIVTGTGTIAMKDEKPHTFHAGAFALMPSRHVHQFHCKQACSLYIYSDAAFDIHYVNDKGEEVEPGIALGKVKETAAKASA